MKESSKLGYTCTCNEYKWAMKHKHIKCCLLLIQVYMQVLLKTASKQVFTTWSTKTKHAKNIIYVNTCKTKIGV